jgi:hypothetical protein
MPAGWPGVKYTNPQLAFGHVPWPKATLKTNERLLSTGGLKDATRNR